jgi:hypothetical protein
MLYQYPLQIRFKLLALAARMTVSDASGKETLYIEQKVLAIREAIRLYNNQQEKHQVFGIKTQQIIDFGAQYSFYIGTDETSPVGSVKEEGLKTLFKASYNILDKGNAVKFIIKETNPWIKVLDYLVSQFPIVGMFAGYFFNPTYQVIHVQTNQTVMLLKKQPSFWERQFIIETIDQTLTQEDETICLLGVITMILLQKNRG